MKKLIFIIFSIPSVCMGSAIFNPGAEVSSTTLPSGSTQYIQNTLTPSTTNQMFNVARGVFTGIDALGAPVVASIESNGIMEAFDHMGSPSITNYLDNTWNFQGDAGSATFARWRVSSKDTTAGFEDSDVDFFIRRNGQELNILRLANDVEGTGASVAYPDDSDLFFRADTSLGTERTQFSFEPLFLDSTDAVRRARAYWYVWDTDKRKAITVDADGSNSIMSIGGSDPVSGVTLYVVGPSTSYVPFVVSGPRNNNGPATQVWDGNGNVVSSVTLAGFMAGRNLVLQSSHTAAGNILEILSSAGVVRASMTADGRLNVATTTVMGRVTIGDGVGKDGTLVVKNQSDDLVTIDNTNNGTLRINATGPHGQSLDIQGRNPTSGDSGFSASGGFSIAVGAGAKALSFQSDTAGVKIKEFLAEGGSIFFEPKSSTSYGFGVRGLASQVFPLMQLRGISSTSADRTQAEIDTAFVDSTDSTRKSRLILRAFDTAARDAFKTQADGTVAITSIGGPNPISTVTFSVPIASNTYMGVVIKSTTNQTGNVLEFWDVNNVVKSSFSADGNLWISTINVKAIVWNNGTVQVSSPSASSGGGSGYAVEPATVTFQLNKGVTASTGTFTSTVTFQSSIYVSSGSSGISGQVTLAGPITVLTNKITADSFVLLTRFGSSGTNGHLNYSNVVPGVSFDITSNNPLDTSTIKWLIINHTP